MCGICGFSGVGNHADLERMMSVMQYRGPDDSGHWSDDKGNHLGHLRLAIIDVKDGQQPLSTSDGSLVVIFNGEIYNHRALRKELESLGHSFQTDHSDTEVLLYGYKQWGTNLTSRLNGMWAFALLDRQNGTLWLSRDRFGKKPLYYSHQGETLIFSSELSSLVAHQAIVPKIDSLSLKKYFAYGYVPAPRSMLSGVEKLPAGHDLLFDLSARKTTLHRYWRLNLEPNEELASNSEELSELLIGTLYRAVETRLAADVPVGIFLSGGIDSSAITALAMSATNGNPIQSFSIGFEESTFDETKYSNQISQLFGTLHRLEILSADKCLKLLDSIYLQLDEPLGDSSLVPSYMMCQVAREDVTVALGGDGSDELFAGYDPFRALKMANIYNKSVPRFAHNFLSSVIGMIPVSHRNMSVDFKIKKFFSALEYDARVRNPIWLGPLPPSYLSDLFGESINIDEIYSEAIDAWDQPRSGGEIDGTLQFYTELYLQNDILTKMDRAGMLNSLEVRSPFLDIDFVDLVRQIPTRLKFDGKTTKKILKQSLQSVLPPEIIYRKKKGFGIPIGQWFKDRHLEIDATKFQGLVNSKCVQQLNYEHLDNKVDWRSFLWAYHGLEKWYDRISFARTIS